MAAGPGQHNVDILEGTARYAGLLLAPAEGFGPLAKALLAFGQGLISFRPRP